MNRRAFRKFLDKMVKQQDVYIVSNWEVRTIIVINHSPYLLSLEHHYRDGHHEYHDHYPRAMITITTLINKTTMITMSTTITR